MNRDLSGADLSNANLSATDLFLANLNDLKVTNAYFNNTKGISNIMKRDLITHGAIFEEEND